MKKNKLPDRSMSSFWTFITGVVGTFITGVVLFFGGSTSGLMLSGWRAANMSSTPSGVDDILRFTECFHSLRNPIMEAF